MVSSRGGGRRAEDRSGLRPGSAGAWAAIAAFTVVARVMHRLPRFRGKVRACNALMKLMRLENQHIIEAVALRSPVRYRAKLDLHSWLQRIAYFEGGYEPDTVDFLRQICPPEGYLLDIGANIGLISIPFTLLTGRPAYAIEAIPANCDRLVENISLNAVQSAVHPIKAALGEREKTVDIQIEGNLPDGGGTGTANIIAETSDHDCERISIALTTLDALSEAGAVPDGCGLIKIDADGYDLKALEGARGFLQRNRPIVFGEFASHCLAWHGQSHADVATFAEGLGYDVHVKQRGAWRFVPLGGDAPDIDLLLTPKERTASLAALFARN